MGVWRHSFLEWPKFSSWRYGQAAIATYRNFSLMFAEFGGILSFDQIIRVRLWLKLTVSFTDFYQHQLSTPNACLP